ncbi:hypothetical protein M405DRAFT_880653 [Rhizopogon salebrosus TDB-379]|nr:hypothetical protein M405DRAFT_880653 [Rhizopogon salebrosus TDB-379]
MTSIRDQHSYILTNCNGGTVLDLSGTDSYSVIGFQNNNGTNQRWVFERVDNFWFIKSVAFERYLAIEGNIKNGTKVVATTSPFRWDVENSDISGIQGIRILAHGTKFCIDLCWGCSANLTKVQLWEKWAGTMQIWATTNHNIIVNIQNQNTYKCVERVLRLWDSKDGVVLKKMEGYDSDVLAIAVSRDGKLIGSGDKKGNLTAWHGDTGKSLTGAIKGHSHQICSLDFSPDGSVLATGSLDYTTKLWSTKTWQVHGKTIICGGSVSCIRYSPSGELLAIATPSNIEIWDPHTSFSKFKAAINCYSLAWTPDGTRLLSGGTTIREWDTSSWQQVGDPWSGHTSTIFAIAVNSAGTLVASTSHDKHVLLWRLSDRQNIAIFIDSHSLYCVAFSMDSKQIFGGGDDNKMSEWTAPEDAPQEQVPEDTLPEGVSEEQPKTKIFSMASTIHNAYILGHLPTAEELLTQEINVDRNNHNSYANRSLLMARKGDWDNALHDALMSISIQPSLTGYLSQGIALCGNKLFWDAMKAFDLAFMFTDGDSKTIHLLLLVKAITLFNANQHQQAISRVQELAVACPNADILACRVVEAYLHVQLGINALDDACYSDAVDHFTTAINSSVFASKHSIYLEYEIFVVLFGWDLKSLWQTANQKRCHALLQAGRLAEAHKAYRYMIDASDTVCCRDWSIAFEQECRALCTSNGDAALSVKDYDKAIELYSAVIDLDPLSDTIIASRCTAKLGKMLWEDALADAQKVIELSPSSYVGYQLIHASMYGARRYGKAIAAFDTMLSKLDHVPDTHTRELRQQYLTSSEVARAIQEAIHARLENTPHRLLNTITGHLCDQGAQIVAFKTSPEYYELLLSIMKNANADFRMERIEKVVEIYFRSAMLSHRWEENEPSLRHIQGKDVYELDLVGGIMKLQSFCRIACDAGYRWAWVDTCCIDQTNNVEVQKSVNAMFLSGALAKSVWNERGWTVQEFLAPRIVLFYQSDWTLYLNDRSPNHKDSAVIMRELGDATGIDPQALVAFHPGMGGIREKLQWVSRRKTTLQEDIAYSLFGIFGIHLPVIYGEKKQNALGRLLQEIIAQSGDITCLDWVGKSSEFNSCLPASITSYEAPPFAPSSLSEDEMQTLVSSLRDAGAVESASQLYTTLDHLTAPRFSHRRLHLPCIVFAVTEVTPRLGHFIYAIEADGLHDLLITTEDKLIPFSRTMPIRQKFLLVRPWDRNLLEWHSSDISSEENVLVDSDSNSQALQLIVRLRQPFSAFLLAQERGGEYKRIATNYDIIAQVKDIAFVRDVMDIRTLEIL